MRVLARIVAILFFVLSAIATLSAVRTFKEFVPAPGEPSTVAVSAAVGAFLVPMVLLILSLSLWKAGARKPTTGDDQTKPAK